VVLAKYGILSPLKKHLYVVHTKVFLDQNMILEFPSEVLATGRRSAKHHITQNISFTAGSEAVGGDWVGSNRKFFVQLFVRYQGKIIHSFTAQILAAKRREAKFDITGRLSYKMGAVAKKSDLIKHS